MIGGRKRGRVEEREEGDERVYMCVCVSQRVRERVRTIRERATDTRER